jgi:Kdo2-lipid IVA lauroyltransferase/acyltransferase
MPCLARVPVVWLAKALVRLPPALLLGLSRALAWPAAPLLARRRRIIAANLALCLPDLDPAVRVRLQRDTLAETIMGAFELLRAWYAPAWRLRDMATIEGMEHLRAALASGRGVLVFTGHFTQSELASRLLSDALGRRVRGVVRRHNTPCVEAEFERARRRVFAPTLAKKDVRGLLRALQAGEVVVYSADQDFSYAHAFVPFFGVPAATLETTPELVRRAGAAMLFFHFHRDGDGRYRLAIEPEWPGWREGTPERAAAIYMRELERVVRAHPAQYLWAHRRFKTRPPGVPPVY